MRDHLNARPSFGKNLSVLRKSHSMTQQQMAELLGKSYSSIQKYEIELAEPPIATLIQIADFFGVTLDELVGRTVPPPKAVNHTTTSWRMTSAMKAREMSYGELAKLTGMTKSNLQRYAVGENKIPPDRIKLLADALNISPAWLAGWTDEN